MNEDLLKIYCMYALDFDPPVCIEKCAEISSIEEATEASKYFENKFMQNFKKIVDPVFGKLNRKQVAAALVAFIEDDIDFFIRCKEAYR